MNIQINPMVLLAFLVYFFLAFEGIYLLFWKDMSKRHDRFFLASSIKSNFKRRFDNNNINSQIEKAGFKISFKEHFKRYQMIRYIIFFVMLLHVVYLALSSYVSSIYIFTIIILFILSAPVIKIANTWTLFGLCMKAMNEDLKKKQDQELSGIIIQLQNIAISQKKEPYTLSFMLSRVVGFCKYSKNGFLKFLSLIDQNKMEEARQAFVYEIDTTLGRDLAQILIELDKINPSEVVEQLSLLEDRIRNEGITIKNRREEVYSNLMYIVPLLLCFAILLNFTMIMLNSAMNFSSTY